MPTAPKGSFSTPPPTAGTNLTRAKDVLHIHVNTVVQRLDRIASLLGEDWQTPDRALEIQLALRLQQLRG